MTETTVMVEGVEGFFPAADRMDKVVIVVLILISILLLKLKNGILSCKRTQRAP